jgi:hypothetical protein
MNVNEIKEAILKRNKAEADALGPSLKYEDFIDKIGVRYDIIEGELKESPQGLFVVSKEFKDYVVYVNSLSLSVSIIAPRSSYLAREYKTRRSDCVALLVDWYKDNKDLDWTNDYKRTSLSQYMDYYINGVGPLFDKYGFTPLEDKTDLQISDWLVYALEDNWTSHIAMYYGNNKILQHIPNKLSSIDTLDPTRVVRAYRHAN